jgi:hypothetical protein
MDVSENVSQDFDKFVFSPITLKGPGAWISKCSSIVLEFNPLPQKNIRNIIQFGLCIEFNPAISWRV